GEQTETLKRRFEVGIRALRPDGRTSRVALPDEVRWPYRGVDEHDASQPIAILEAGFQRHVTAEAVTDDDSICVEARIVHYARHLVREDPGVISTAVVAVAHPGQIDRGDAVVVVKKRRDERPPVTMPPVAVHEHDTGLRGAVAPQQIVDLRALDDDLAILIGRLKRFAEPTRCARYGHVRHQHPKRTILCHDVS